MICPGQIRWFGAFWSMFSAFLDRSDRSDQHKTGQVGWRNNQWHSVGRAQTFGGTGYERIYMDILEGGSWCILRRSPNIEGFEGVSDEGIESNVITEMFVSWLVETNLKSLTVESVSHRTGWRLTVTHPCFVRTKRGWQKRSVQFSFGWDTVILGWWRESCSPCYRCSSSENTGQKFAKIICDGTFRLWTISCFETYCIIFS